MNATIKTEIQSATARNKYSICNSSTGKTLIEGIELDADTVENVSSDSAEGHFQANRISELEDLGTQSVFAVIH